MISTVVQCIGIARHMIRIIQQCIGMQCISFRKHWKLLILSSCAYRKLTCAIAMALSLHMSHVLHCIGIKLIMISIVVQCIKIALLIISRRAIHWHCITYDKHQSAMHWNYMYFAHRKLICAMLYIALLIASRPAQSTLIL